MFGEIYQNKTVLITGHTGFKGSWLALWLKELGSNIIGYALNPQLSPNHFDLLKLDIISIIGDIRDLKKLKEVFQTYKPEIIFHLAAQPLVRYSYKEPLYTFETNVMGTINIFEACRNIESIRVIINITSDKCYENREWIWGYRENDPMGGYDPYSASKGCSELVTNSYRNSFFNINDYGKTHNILLASVRAGNVIGGGDWAEDRLIPDIMKAASKNEKVIIRNPQSTRPWQHVLEPLSGYLMLGQRLLEGKKEFADGWNFGSDDGNNITVGNVVNKMNDQWNRIQYDIEDNKKNPHEAGHLKLDCSKARSKLCWQPNWDINKTFQITSDWYKEFYEKGIISSLDNLNDYIEDAKIKNLEWTENQIIRSNKEELKKVLKTCANLVTKNYYNAIHKSSQMSVFIPGQSKINYGGRVFDEKEMINLVDSSLDFWLTNGKYAEKFEKEFTEFLGVKYCSLVNSGSSANLLAFMALTSHKLDEKRIRKGDEVITVAAGFPTTVTPIIQYGAIPVFVDITIPTYNIDCDKLDKALSDKTKAVMIAHTLGNPFDIDLVKAFCEKHNLWLIEDNCDALGSKYLYKGEWKYTGTFGDIATSSFYPPHHITMGEGGAVYTNNLKLKRIVESLRDWGRDCFCNPGSDDTCNRRFSQKFGELPLGYDHKYVYSHFGYNLKLTDMQAAIGCAQLEKLNDFILARKRNWGLLSNMLQDVADKFILPEPTLNSDPSWFGFLLTVKKDSNINRSQIVSYLEKSNIQTRTLFAGNIIKHPCFDEMRRDNKKYRVVGELNNTDIVMDRSFWIGVYPGITEEKIEYISKIIINLKVIRNY